ncbi:DUF2479 domain-containing protein [Leuconostoc citreum]|uniref:BppU family phage baseplate upper protein n=1 Tax=Leuconostoc citreum TaxID=33964 RepID=UPI0021A55C64|nr:BppU family phage baseplate upper protein [Leuconostoc citreum]MCT3055825.1 DUF2479 domain-containing protein [Leuconostoc citreum]MCT3063227.1 DUF2479 domain-containing protein [Leuconostoc citreum]
MSNQYLSFDVTKQSTPQQLITGRQGDSQLKFVTMLFWDGDKNVPYDLTGKQVAFEALKPDNTHIVDYEGITVLDATAGLVRYSFNEQVFSVAGTMQQAFFKITHTDSDNNVIADSTLEVAINILENRVEFGINSKDYLSEYDDLIAQVKKKFDDYAATVKDSIDKAQALHDQIVQYTNLINSNGVILRSDFGDISSIKQPLGKTFVDKLNNEFNDRGINVKWYGAKGDGVTNDTAAFQKLADYVNSQTKMLTIYFPDGEYLWDTTIQFNTEVLLTGSTGAWLNYQGTGDAILFGKDGMSETDYLNNRVYICDGLNFKGGINSQYLLHFNKFVTQPIVRNCRFDDAGGVSKDYKAFALYFDTDNWHGWVHHNQFNVSKNAGTRQFLSMATYGNSRIVIEHNVITSLDGFGVAINVDGANCQVVNNKIEGYQVNVRIGSLGINTIVAYNYFEKNGQTVSSAVQIGDLDPKVTTYPTGIKIIGNYANLHVLADNPVSYFVGPSNASALIKNVTMNDNWINAYSDGEQSNYIVSQNDLPGQIGNVANNNSGNSIAGILDYSGRVNASVWNGTDSARTIETALSLKNTSRSILTDDGIYEDNVLDSKYIPILAKALAASKDYTVTLNGNTVYKAFSTGQLSFGKLSASANYDFSGALKANTIGVNKQSDNADAGQVFEGTDGNLYYMNMAGVKKQLTN